MPLSEDNASKEERRITGKTIRSKFRQHVLLNPPFLSLPKIPDFLNSLALVDLPEQDTKATPDYPACPLGYSRGTALARADRLCHCRNALPSVW